MGTIGFSTGALAPGDVGRALRDIESAGLRSVEFSALRWPELEPVAARMAEEDLSRFTYVSFHAPSVFSWEQEPGLVQFLAGRIPARATIVVHPDSIRRFDLWNQLGERLAIENMDKRKPGGRSAEEMEAIFRQLPRARFCFDIGHARQCDPSMTEAYRLLSRFLNRLVQLHVSDVTSDSRHGRLSETAIVAFRELAQRLPADVPLIVESQIAREQMRDEVTRVERAFGTTRKRSSRVHLRCDA